MVDTVISFISLESLKHAQSIMSFGIIFTVIVAWLSWRSKQNHDRRNLAIGYSLTKNKDYFEARARIFERYKENFSQIKPISGIDLSDLVSAKDRDLEKDIRIVLAHWEIMAISICDDVIDEKTSFEVVGTTLVTTVRVLFEYIKEIRSIYANRRRYDYLLILFHHWSRRIDLEQSAGTLSRYEDFMKKGENFKRVVRKSWSTK